MLAARTDGISGGRRLAMPAAMADRRGHSAACSWKFWESDPEVAKQTADREKEMHESTSMSREGILSNITRGAAPVVERVCLL